MNGSMHGLVNGLMNDPACEAMHRTAACAVSRSGSCADVRREPVARGRRDGPRLVDRVVAATLAVAVLRERVRQRRRLLALAGDPAFLEDVGLSRADALQEGGKPFWRS